MEILAKKLIIDENHIKTQDLRTHTEWVIEEALNLIDDKSLEKVSKQSGFCRNKIIDLIFFSAYFHDIGKATQEFQSTIMNGTKSYHSLYSSSALVNIKDFDFLEDDVYINLLLITVLTHHTLLSDKGRGMTDVSFHFLNNANIFFEAYKKNYQNYLKKSCKYKFKFEIFDDMRIEINDIENDLKYIKENQKLRTIYSYVSGILNIADCLASARFSETLPNIVFKQIPSKNYFIEKLSFDRLRKFQEKLSKLNKSILTEIPTGEGKTEGSLLWAINNLYNEHSKIIYTLPTQITSNKLYERVLNLFGKENCGLIHSSAKIYLEKKYEKENGEIDNSFKSDFLLSKSFNKPITVSTIDSLLKYFINIGRFNIATKNFLNSVVIIDEVHSYDFKLMGFLKRFLELCDELDIKVCLMSASIPNKLKELLGIQNYPLLSQKDLFEKKANEIIKKELYLDDDLDLIYDKFQNGKNVLIIRNTIKSATTIYNELKKFNNINKSNIILYHSTFKKRDRVKKEELIFEKLDAKKPFILVATQIVEISLDIDFDILFTDNAPIDALIQRFGRVNRKKLIEKKGKIYIYQNENIRPYKNEYLLNLTFQTIKNGYFELNKYVKWLNIVYDKLFDNDIQVKNTITRLFDDAYLKYDDTLKKLHGIEKSSDNYDLRDIELPKNDYLLYEDYINDRISYEYSISLSLYFEGKNKENIYKIQDDNLPYKVLKNLEYSFENGIKFDNNNGMEELGS